MLFGKRLSRWESLGGLLSLSGVVLLISHGDIHALLGLALNAGDLWMLAAVLAWSLYTVCLSRRPAGVHPMLLLAAFVVVGPAVGSLFIHLMPVFAAILSTLLLDEQPLWYHLVGMALVLGSIVLTVRRRHHL